ncbi:hypothetical protein ACMFMF_003694 [Clarireedia jacksonii]
MLNSDHTAAPFSSGSRAPKVFVNEVRSCSAFANHSGRGKTTIEGKTYPTVSVESFHDGIHNLLGTGGGSYDEDPQNNHKLGGVSGHIANPQVANKSNQGFASNVERLLCLHQAIYPDKYLDDGAPSNNLAPFLHENCGGAFWKSIDKWIKNYWNSGFAVPGAMQPQGDFKDMKAELTKYLVETYLWAANNTPHNLKNWLRNLSGHAHLVHREVAFAAFNKQEVSTPIVHDSAVKSVEVLGLSDKINESLPASALEDLSEEKRPTYQITWNTYVKIRNLLTASDRSDILIPQAQKKTIDNLTPEEVVPFLKENLQWRMTDLATNLLHGEPQAGLKILISHLIYIAPDQEHLLGQYGPFVP